jgi:hypothetical protein
MPKNILLCALIFLTLASSVFVWASVSGAAELVDVKNWVILAVSFSVLFILLVLDIIVARNKLWLILFLLLPVLSNFFFAFTLHYALLSLLAFLFLLGGAVKIRWDLKLSRKIMPAKSARMGKSFIVLALSLLISGQYFFTIEKNNFQQAIPYLNIQEAAKKFAPKILSVFNPRFKNAELEEMTIDDFIIKTQEDQMRRLNPQYGEDMTLEEMLDDQVGTPLTLSQKQEYREMILREGRQQISEVTGYEVKGDGLVTDVFSKIIDEQIGGIASADPEKSEAFLLIHIIFTFLFFLTLVSAGSVLAVVLVPLAHLVFVLLVKIRAVKIQKVPSEIEVLET